MDVGRQTPGEEDEEDILQEKGAAPNEIDGERQGSQMGVEMEAFGGNEGDEDDTKAELAGDGPEVFEIGPGMFGDEDGGVPDGVGDAGDIHIESGIIRYGGEDVGVSNSCQTRMARCRQGKGVKEHATRRVGGKGGFNEREPPWMIVYGYR